ncbi:hypothetical protein EP7_005170 [Isosphaeraceae bacterium EP7]
MNTTSGKQHPDHRRAGPNLARGLGASLLFGLIGAAIPMIVLAIMMVGRWMIFGASEFDRRADLARFMIEFSSPSIGIGCVFAAAGWATYAPASPQRFARTLAIIALISIVAWPLVILFANSFSPRFKRSPQSPVPILTYLLLGTPPLLASYWLTKLRNDCSKKVGLGSCPPFPGFSPTDL